MLKKLKIKAKQEEGSVSKKLITTLQDFDASKEYLEESGVVYKFKQMAFRPNRLVAFAPCDQSWHSVPLQKLPEGVARNTVQGFVSFHSKEGEGIPDKETCQVVGGSAA